MDVPVFRGKHMDGDVSWMIQTTFKDINDAFNNEMVKLDLYALLRLELGHYYYWNFLTVGASFSLTTYAIKIFETFDNLILLIKSTENRTALFLISVDF